MKVYEIEYGLKGSNPDGGDSDNWRVLNIPVKDFEDALKKARAALAKGEFIVQINKVMDLDD